MRRTLIRLAPLAAALVLLGCSNKDVEAPVEAPDIDNRFSLQSLWSASTDGVGGFYSQLSPAAADHCVYAAARDGRVYAFELAGGGRLWRADLADEEENGNKRSARLSGGVSAGGGKIAVGSENGYIYVLNATDGSLAWKDFVGSEVVSAPAFAADGLKLFVLDSRGTVSAYDLLSGDRLWTAGGSGSALQLRSQSRPLAVGDRYLIVGGSDGSVSVLSQQNGLTLAEVTVNRNYGSTALQRVSDVASTPLLLDGSMYTTAYNGGFIRYDFASGSVRSRLDYHSSRDIAFDEECFVLTGDNGYVYSIDRRDNTENWVNTALKNRNVTAPAIYGDYAVVGDYEGYLYFISLATGVIESCFELDDSPMLVPPQVLGDSLLVSHSSGDLELVRYDPRGAAAAKSTAAAGELLAGAAAVTVGGGRLSEAAFGLSEEELQARRAQAVRLVSQIEARQRAAEAQLAEYNRRKAEYERQRAEYERRQAAYEEQRRQQLSGFGIMPGVKSEGEEEAASAPAPAAPRSADEDAGEKSSSFGI